MHLECMNTYHRIALGRLSQIYFFLFRSLVVDLLLWTEEYLPCEGFEKAFFLRRVVIVARAGVLQGDSAVRTTLTSSLTFFLDGLVFRTYPLGC